MWLVKNNVPIDVALQMSDDMRTALSIMFSEFEGAEFDIEAFVFKERQ